MKLLYYSKYIAQIRLYTDRTPFKLPQRYASSIVMLKVPLQIEEPKENVLFLCLLCLLLTVSQLYYFIVSRYGKIRL